MCIRDSGETEEDFKDTMELVEKIGFVNSYSFIFSPRPGTPAATKELNNLATSAIRLKKLQNTLANYQHKNNKNTLAQVLAAIRTYIPELIPVHGEISYGKDRHAIGASGVTT